MNKFIVCLRLTSTNRSLESIDALLGIVPDKVWRKGERRAGASMLLEQENGFEIASGLPDTTSVEVQVNAVLQRVMSIEGMIRALHIDSVQLTCIGYVDTMTGIHFDADTVNAISRLGASVDIDFYLTQDDAC